MRNPETKNNEKGREEIAPNKRVANDRAKAVSRRTEKKRKEAFDDSRVLGERPGCTRAEEAAIRIVVAHFALPLTCTRRDDRRHTTCSV